MNVNVSRFSYSGDCEADPAGDEGRASKRGDGAEGPDAGDRQDVEAAGEEDDADQEEPAGDRGSTRDDRYDQQAESVDEVIEDGTFVNVHRILVEASAKAVGAKGSDGDGQGQEDGGDGGPVHLDFIFAPLSGLLLLPA